jgi:hypothetical protein
MLHVCVSALATALQQALLGLVRHTESDAWLSLGLMFQLSVLPLSRALTALSGSQWSKTLQVGRLVGWLLVGCRPAAFDRPFEMHLQLV